MPTSRAAVLPCSRFVALAFAVAMGCGGAADEPGVAPRAPDDPEPTFTAEELAALRAASPGVLPPSPPDVSNARSDDGAAARLGQRLFFDPGLSGALLHEDNDGGEGTLGRAGETGKVACSGCHVPEAGFLDDRSRGKQISLAAGWVLRRTPSLLDVGHARLLMWDGRSDTLHGQVFDALESRDEMNSSRLFVAHEIFARYGDAYREVFGDLPPLADAARFPPLDAARTGCRPGGPDAYVCHGMPGDGAEYDGMAGEDQEAVTRVVANAGKAIAAYERLLACGPSRFDAWMHGDASALSRAEQRGAALFAGKAKCAGCHAGPFFTDQGFHNVGLRPGRVALAFVDEDDPGAAVGLPKALANPLNVRGAFSDGDDGRLPLSVPPSMLGAFRTPPLRCVAQRPSFMHTGHMTSLVEVVAFFDRGGHDGGYLGEKTIVPLGLTARERADLVAFLGALTGPGPAESLRRAP